MKKIPSLFKRDYEGARLIYDDVVPESAWVLAGEGTPTEKYDGSSCMVKDGVLYKRYDRKLQAWAKKQHQENSTFLINIQNYKDEPEGWIAAEEQPNHYTGHWPGWLPVDFEQPENKYHKRAWQVYTEHEPLYDGTYELVGDKVQGNPYQYGFNHLVAHGQRRLVDVPLTFTEIGIYLTKMYIEGIVWHHPDGRMAKIKRRDYGIPWPEKEE